MFHPHFIFSKTRSIQVLLESTFTVRPQIFFSILVPFYRFFSGNNWINEIAYFSKYVERLRKVNSPNPAEMLAHTTPVK